MPIKKAFDPIRLLFAVAATCTAIAPAPTIARVLGKTTPLHQTFLGDQGTTFDTAVTSTAPDAFVIAGNTGHGEDLVGGAAGKAGEQEVYFGVADQWHDLLNHPDQWAYVRQHASGFYVNFIMMNRVIRHTTGLSQTDLTKTCGLFANHTAYLESDIRTPSSGHQGGGGGGANDGASAEQEQQYIGMLHSGGCKISFTSLDYGWSRERAKNLTEFDLLQGEHRLNFVQTAPWKMNGDIAGASAANEKIRQLILSSDGVSTDGPLGFWLVDRDGFRSANLSLIKFAHQHHKKVMVMLAPYGGGTANYDAKRDFLKVGQDMVRYLESHHAAPDIWAVFEYATDIPAVPEQINGQPANTTSGLAYWLIQHIANPRQFP